MAVLLGPVLYMLWCLLALVWEAIVGSYHMLPVGMSLLFLDDRFVRSGGPSITRDKKQAIEIPLMIYAYYLAAKILFCGIFGLFLSHYWWLVPALGLLLLLDRSARGVHMVQFETGGAQVVRLRNRSHQRAGTQLLASLTGSPSLDWLVRAPAGSEKRRGGNGRTVMQYTRGANAADVFEWLSDHQDAHIGVTDDTDADARICCFYAGVFLRGEAEDGGKLRGIDGPRLVELTESDLEEKLHITIAAHREALVRSFVKLAGFLGRYLLDPGRPAHVSATCVLIFAQDRLTEEADGSFKKVAIKCMKNVDQFETEMRVRCKSGLSDPRYVVGALRSHVPRGYSTYIHDSWRFHYPEADTQSHEEHGELSDGADASCYDSRLSGKYIIVMERAECDLGSDISHGHYAGSNEGRPKIRSILQDLATCLLYCEEKRFVHADIKSLNAVLCKGSGDEGREKLVAKLIDFDASARIGDLCHLKFSSAFATPQLARKLLQYEEETGHSPTDASAQPSWAEWASAEEQRHQPELQAQTKTALVAHRRHFMPASYSIVVSSLHPPQAACSPSGLRLASGGRLASLSRRCATRGGRSSGCRWRRSTRACP